MEVTNKPLTLEQDLSGQSRLGVLWDVQAPGGLAVTPQDNNGCLSK